MTRLLTCVIGVLVLVTLVAPAVSAQWLMDLEVRYFGSYNAVRADFSTASNVYTGPWRAYHDHAATDYFSDLYCAQLYSAMPEGWKHFTVYPTATAPNPSPPGPPYSHEGLNWAAAMYNHVAPGLYLNYSVDAQAQRSALQMAIWEALYDWNDSENYTNSISLGDGSFYVEHFDSTPVGYTGEQITTMANALLSNPVYQYQGSGAYFDDGQNLLGPIPEPSAIILLGVGLLGTGLILNKRRKK
ncbi:MAG: PEP-CTERM sorting domain-containing protein [Candidatus Eisenbacteria sp.]|nr:PEP-CTERM sorting domain-containing protein [Candidatus Eisenbacteria bacterium]